MLLTRNTELDARQLALTWEIELDVLDCPANPIAAEHDFVPDVSAFLGLRLYIDFGVGHLAVDRIDLTRADTLQ